MHRPGEIHGKFKLNGLSFSKEDLREVAYSLVKEGEDFEIDIGDFLLDWFSDNPGITVKSSGSTGNPKEFVLKKKHMVNSALATGAYFSLQPGNTALQCLPTDFIAGKMMFVRAMVLGLELDYAAPSSNPLLGSEKEYDFCAMVPLQAAHTLPDIHKVRIMIIGGAPVGDDLKKALWPKPTCVFETYGMTETVTHIAIRALSNRALAFQGGARETTAGHSSHPFTALPGISLSVDSRNCLVIEAPEIAVGPVVTNDLVDLLSERQFHWLGRNDTVINSGGVKIIPEQLEEKIRLQIDSPFFVAGVPDTTLGYQLVLVVEGHGQEETLRAKLNSLGTLHKYEHPRAIYFTETFLRTATNKVKRQETLALVIEQSG